MTAIPLSLEGRRVLNVNKVQYISNVELNNANIVQAREKGSAEFAVRILKETKRAS